MHLESLQIFCDVARQRSFSQAAQANDITQSAVSQIIAQLEEHLQAKLVDRSTRPLRLTQVGQQFFEGSRAVLEQFRELEASVRSAQAEIAGTVQVAAIYSVGLGDMGQMIQRFTATQPQAQVHVEYLHPDRVYNRVLEGSADLGLVSFPRRSPKLVTLPWREEEMVLACPPRHDLASRLALRMTDLTGQPYVHFERTLAIRRKVDRFLRDQNVAVDVQAEFDNIENIKQAIAEGAGVALLPRPTLRREIKARTLVAVPLFAVRFTRPMGIIHRRRHGLSAAAALFLEILRSQDQPSGEPALNGHGRAPQEITRGRAHGRVSTKG